MKAFLYILGLIIIFISPFLGETQINIKDIFQNGLASLITAFMML